MSKGKGWLYRFFKHHICFCAYRGTDWSIRWQIGKTWRYKIYLLVKYD